MAHDAKIAMMTTRMIMVWASVVFEAADVDEVKDVEGYDVLMASMVHDRPMRNRKRLLCCRARWKVS